MNSPIPNDLDGLLNSLADGLLTPEEEARLAEILKSDAAARRRYRQFMGLQASLMWDYAALATPASEVAPMRETVKSRRWPVIWAMAATIVFAATLAAIWIPRHSKDPISSVVELVSATGAVSWSDDSGNQRVGLARGTKLTEGTLVVESEAGSAQLRFRDGTQLTLSGEAELAFSETGQKRLTLRRGTFTAEVSPQPAGHPLLIRTTTAELTVVGTSFSLAADPRQTALNVETGKVRMRRLADGQSVDVSARHAAVAFLDARSELRPAQSEFPPTSWSQSFSTPPSSNSRGEWLAADDALAGRMRAVPYVAARGKDGVPIIHYGVSARVEPHEPGGLVTVEDGAVFRARYRLVRPTMLKLFLSCQRGGMFAGNFEGPLPASAPDADGWITAELPVSRLRPIMAEHPDSAGTQVRMVLLNSIETDVSLEVAEFGIRPAP